MNKKFTKLIAALALLALLAVPMGMWGETTYEQLTSIANIDENAQYVLGIDGTGFHYSGTSNWGLTALPSAQTPIYYTLTKASDGNSFTAQATIGNTTYYLQVPTSNTFSMATSAGTNTDLIIGTTQVSGTNYAVANKTTTARHLRINGTSGLRSYAGTTGTMAFFYKVSGTSMSVSPASIDFGNENTINPNEPYTRTFNVTFANLTESLSVNVGSGLTGVSVSPTSIAVNAISPQTVTVSYNPTEAGSISGNISVNSSEVTEALVAVTGSAYDPENIDTYEKYTGALVEGDYVIYVNNYALKNTLNNGPRFNNESVTPTNNTITNPSASIVWHIAPVVNTEYWTIYNADVQKYAGGTTTKNQGALYENSTDDHAKWSIYYQTGILYIKNIGRSLDSSDPNNCYLRQNGTYGWGTYVSGTGAAPQLYKKVITNQVATPTFSVAAGTYYEAKSVELNCETTGATIYYTTDGTTPSASNGTEYTTAISVSTTTTIKAIAVNDGMNDSDIATATYIIEQPYSTMDEIFAAATTAGSTAASHMVEFGSWFVTGVSTNGKNVYVTDGTKGFVIRDDDGGLASTYHADDLIEGTVWASLKLNQGYAQLTDVDASGLTIEEYGAPDFAEISMANLSGINTGALVQYVGLTCSVSSGNYYLSDGTTTLQVYNLLYADAYSNFEAGKTYTISGVYQQYGDTKEILPRSVDDIVEVLIPSITVTPATANPSANDVEGTLAITYDNLTITDMSDFAVQFYDENNQELNGANVPGWIEVLVAEAEGGNGYVVSYTMDVNEGEARSAYFKVFALGDEDYVYSNLVTVTQAAYVATTTYTLVTSQSDLMPGKHYIIVGSNAAGTEFYAMGEQTTAGSNKIRSAVAVTKNENQVIGTEDVCEFVISGDATHGWTFYDISSNMYLKAVYGNEIDQSATLLAEYCYWTIDFNVESAIELIQSIKYTDRYINYNHANSRFANYKTSSNQRPVSIYVKVDDTDIELHSPTTLSSTNQIIVPANGILTVQTNGGLVNTDPANLVVRDGGQLIVVDNGAKEALAATVEKNIAAWTTGTPVGGWYFIASPIDANDLDPVVVDNLTTDDDDDNNHTFDLYKYVADNVVNEEPKPWYNYRAHSEVFVLANGQGYLYANASAQTLAFKGAVKPYSTTNNTVTLSETGWNLIGNPFTCEVSVNVAFSELNNGTAVVNKTANSTIMPCAGIAVNGNAGAEVTFTMVEPQQSAAPSNPSLQMTLAQQATNRGNAAIDNAIVSFNEGCELEKFYFGTQNANLYIPQGNEEYAIVSTEAQGTMPVNFRANENGEYTLTVNPENVEMNYLHLIDNMTGADTDLLSSPSYTFNAKTTDYESRFKLVFVSNTAFDEENGDNQTFAFYSNGQYIIANEGEATLQVIDITGRILSSETINGSVSKSINAPTGVYMLRLINGNDVKVQKVVIK